MQFNEAHDIIALLNHFWVLHGASSVLCNIGGLASTQVTPELAAPLPPPLLTLINETFLFMVDLKIGDA